MINYLLSIFRLDRNVLRFVTAWAMIGLIHLGINTVLVNLYIIKLGFDLSFLGILNGSGQVIWALFAIPAGLMGTRFGLRNNLIAGFVIVALALGCFLSVAWLPRAAWEAGLLLSNGFVWIGAALVVVNGTPYLMAMAPENERGKAFTLQSALFSMAAFLGSLAAGILPDFLVRQFPGTLNEVSAYNAVLWLAIPAYLGSALLLLKARRDPPLEKSSENAPQEAAPIGLLVFLGILFGLQIGSENATGMFMNVYLANDLLVANALIGGIFAFTRLLSFFLSPIQPIVLKRWGTGPSMTASYVLVAGCAALIAFLPNGLAAAAGFILFSLVTSFTGTARTLFGQESVQPRWRTAVTAVLTISMAASGSLVGFGAGGLIDASGFRGLFLVSAMLALLVVLLYGARQRLRSKQTFPTPSEAIPLK